MKFRTRPPKELMKMSMHGDSDGIESVLNCWSCAKPFRAYIGYTTVLFDCPYCFKTNELEDE